MTKNTSPDTEVLYNAACPVCRREIEHYAKISRHRNLPICFTDLNDPASLQQWGLAAQDAARRLHVRRGNKLYDGIPAFIVLWREIPRYRWLAHVVSLPGVFRLAVWTYDLVLAPALYQLHLRRIRNSCDA